MKIRQGRRNGHALYLQLGDEPTDLDPFLGSAVSPAIARRIAEAANAADEHAMGHLAFVARRSE